MEGPISIDRFERWSQFVPISIPPRSILNSSECSDIDFTEIDLKLVRVNGPCSVLFYDRFTDSSRLGFDNMQSNDLMGITFDLLL